MTSRHEGSSGSAEDRFALLQRCPLCYGTFEQQEVAVLAARSSHRTVHMQCPLCLVAIIATVVSSHAGAGFVATVTDLSASDAKTLIQTRPICDDDILSCHALLRRPGALEKRIWKTHQSSLIS